MLILGDNSKLVNLWCNHSLNNSNNHNNNSNKPNLPRPSREALVWKVKEKGQCMVGMTQGTVELVVAAVRIMENAPQLERKA